MFDLDSFFEVVLGLKEKFQVVGTAGHGVFFHGLHRSFQAILRIWIGSNVQSMREMARTTFSHPESLVLINVLLRLRILISLSMLLL